MLIKICYFLLNVGLSWGFLVQEDLFLDTKFSLEWLSSYPRKCTHCALLPLSVFSPVFPFPSYTKIDRDNESMLFLLSSLLLLAVAVLISDSDQLAFLHVWSCGNGIQTVLGRYARKY